MLRSGRSSWQCGGASRLRCLTPASSAGGVSGWVGVQLSSFHGALSKDSERTFRPSVRLDGMNISKKFVFGKFQLLHDTMYREGTGMVAMRSRKTRRSPEIGSNDVVDYVSHWVQLIVSGHRTERRGWPAPHYIMVRDEEDRLALEHQHKMDSIRASGASQAPPISSSAFAYFMLKKKGKLASWQDSAKATVRHRALEKASSASVLSVESVVAARKLAYHLQGDSSLNTKSSFKQRQKLRRHPAVLAQLERWWEAATRTAVERGCHDTSRIAKEDYLTIYRLLYIILLGVDEYNDAECEMEALEEWQKDSVDGVMMERAQFLDAVFEVCDLYTPTLEPSDCESERMQSTRTPRLMSTHAPLVARCPAVLIACTFSLLCDLRAHRLLVPLRHP